MKQIIRKTFLTLLGGIFLSSGAWADTTIGAVDKGWSETSSQSSAYTIASGKTLTLTFKVTNYSGDWAGYVLSLTNTNATAATFGGNDGYVWFRSPDFAWYKTNWNVGALVSNTNTKGAMTQAEWQAFVKDATTVMAIQRFGTQVFVKTTVTKSSVTYTHIFVLEIGTTSDIKAFLCADNAVISISSAVTSDTGTVESTTATIGAEDNSGAFGASAVTTLEPESVLTMHFTNHSKKENSYNNYGIELNYSGYFANIVLGGGRWGELLADNTETDPVTTPVTKLEETFNDFGTDFINKMDGADVTLTIARNGRVVTITAVHTPSDNSTPFTLKYTLEPNATAFPNFATENIAVNLSTDQSHIVYKFPIQKVNAEVSEYGWSTFSSNYKLDFSGVTGLKAHAVTGHTGTAVNLADVSIAAANSGLLLESSNTESATFYNIPISIGTAYSGTNLLVAGTGAAVSATDGKTAYVLSKDGTKAVFKKIVSGTPATVAANKAYLLFNEVIAARSIDVDGDGTTGIGNLKVGKEDNVYYDLQGRRVLYPKKGLYIVNGKKVIINK